MQYKEFMSRIHKYIMGAKKMEKELRADIKKQADPFNKQEVDKVDIKSQLDYGTDGHATVKLRMRELRKKECKTEKEWKATSKVLNFISHARWSEEEAEVGGITWLELFIWYKMHAPAEETKPLAPKTILQKEIAEFKSHVRRVMTLCVVEEQEWHLQTSYGRASRLKSAMLQ